MRSTGPTTPRSTPHLRCWFGSGCKHGPIAASKSLVLRHLVEPGLLAEEHAARLARLEERRSAADYRAHEDIDADQARALVADARCFLDAALALLRRMPA